MTDHTPLTHCLVLINKGATLRGVALEAGFVSAQESKSAAFEPLLNICRCAFNCHPDVRVVAISAAHFAFQHRMVMRQLELCPHFQVALETSLGGLTRIDNSVRRAAAFYVKTSRPVTCFAANILCVFALCLQSRMRRSTKITRDILVTCLATFRANELRAGNAWRRKNCSVRRAARKQNHGERGCAPDAPKQFFALTVGPSS